MAETKPNKPSPVDSPDESGVDHQARKISSGTPLFRQVVERVNAQDSHALMYAAMARGLSNFNAWASSDERLAYYIAEKEGLIQRPT